MKCFMAGLLVGMGAGIAMLVCPQVRHFVDKMEDKIENKKKKAKEKAEE